jgi:outer membrane receptor protein involved in Fe transport
MKRLRVENLFGVVVGIGLLLCAAPAAADNTIVVNTGTITGAVVEVKLPDGSVESFEDSDGDGVITMVTTSGGGDHELTVKAGEQTETAVLALGGGNIINVFFRPSAPEGRRIEIQVVFQGREIVVTANKREQQLQDVPLSVGMVTADFVERENASEFVDVAGSVPGVQFQTTGGGENRVTVRGISSGVGVATVGYYLDEISTTNGTFQGVPDFNLFDVERVEVLRGPQGTL